MAVAWRYAYIESCFLNQRLMSTIAITCWFSCTREKILSQKQHDIICINHNTCLYLFILFLISIIALLKSKGLKYVKGEVKAKMSPHSSSRSTSQEMLSQLQRSSLSIQPLYVYTSVWSFPNAVRLWFLSWFPASLFQHHFKVTPGQ